MNKLFKLIASLSILIVFFGCASTKEAKPVVSQEGNPPAAAEEQKAPEEKKADLLQPVDETKQKKQQDEEILMPEMKKSLSHKPLPQKVEREPIDPKRVAHIEGNVVLNAESMPLSDFIVYALGDTLKVTFFMDEQVMGMKNPITLRMTQEMPAEKALGIVIGFLEKNDLTAEEKGGSLYIIKPKPQAAPAQPADYRIGRDVEDSPATVIQIVPIKYLHAMEVMQLLFDLFKDVKMQPYGKENSIMFKGSSSAIREAVEFLKLIDVPTFREKRLYLSLLTYWPPIDFINQITAILEGVGYPVARNAVEPGIFFLPIRYLNSVLIVAPDDSTLKFVMDWKRRLDTPESAGPEEKAFTFTPHYSRASELVDSIRRLYGVMPATTVAAPIKNIQGGAPAAVPLPVSTGSSASLPGMKISADDRRNMIVLITTPATYKSLLSIFEELDKPPKQVLIEATIAELTLKDDLQYGLEWYIKNKMQNGTYTLQTLGQLGLSTSSGLAYKFLSDSQKFQAAINAFAQQNRINVLSTPRIMVLDNASATINVGSDVPLLSGSTTSTSASTEVTVNTQAVSYRTTGITLTVTPTINTEGLLTLSISLDDSEAQTNNTSNIDSPLILTRTLNTSIVAASSQTILLGGMMSDNISDTETKVPLLGDIPLIGNLFKTRSKSKSKTELIIMLTPHILTNVDDAAKITEEFRKELKWLK
ncbi:MAG: type II secretion system secretin GspD [Nitrospirae bacterium]|nr:type II secretion system secretin GspD [Nitrospirota bacterium]